MCKKRNSLNPHGKRASTTIENNVVEVKRMSNPGQVLQLKHGPGKLGFTIEEIIHS
jgi:hypothetical protein